jgi:hypothetical protein
MLAVEASAAADAATAYPQRAGGEGACLPEDCGGPGGFADLKALLAGPPSPEREEMRAGWRGTRPRALRPGRCQRRGGISLRKSVGPDTPA